MSREKLIPRGKHKEQIICFYEWRTKGKKKKKNSNKSKSGSTIIIHSQNYN